MNFRESLERERFFFQLFLRKQCEWAHKDSKQRMRAFYTVFPSNKRGGSGSVSLVLILRQSRLWGPKIRPKTTYGSRCINILAYDYGVKSLPEHLCSFDQIGFLPLQTKPANENDRKISSPVLCVLWLCIASSAICQSPNTSSLILAVLDPTGGAIKDANLSIVSGSTVSPRNGFARGDGSSFFPALPLTGTYEIRV